MLKPGKVAPGATPRAHPVGLAAYCMHNPSFKPPGMAQVGPGAAFLMHATCGASWLLGTCLWALVDHAHAKFSFRMLEDTACNMAPC